MTASDSHDERLPDSYQEGDVWSMNRWVVAEGFPTMAQLRRGIMLGNIAYAFLVGGSDSGISDFSWHGDTYVEDIMQGELLAVAFGDKAAVSTFYSG